MGDALYIPPYWWHHVQSLTPETTSMAMWFFEYFPLSHGKYYGINPGSEELVLMRLVEEEIGDCFPNVPGEEDCTKARPVKAGQVAAYAQWLKVWLGLSTTAPEAGALDQLKSKPETLAKHVLEVIKEKAEFDDPRTADDEARKRL